MRSPSSHGSSDQDFVDFLENELELANEDDQQAGTASNSLGTLTNFENWAESGYTFANCHSKIQRFGCQ